jgi:hypothetical protein
MPPNFRVNNLLLLNFLESDILFDSKLVEESIQILGGHNYNCLNSLSSRISLLQLVKLQGDEP